MAGFIDKIKDKFSELKEQIAAAAGFRGEIRWDASRPDGMYRKLMDSSKARKLGWKPEITLDEGIERTVAEYNSGNEKR